MQELAWLCQPLTPSRTECDTHSRPSLAAFRLLCLARKDFLVGKWLCYLASKLSCGNKLCPNKEAFLIPFPLSSLTLTLGWPVFRLFCGESKLEQRPPLLSLCKSFLIRSILRYRPHHWPLPAAGDSLSGRQQPASCLCRGQDIKDCGQICLLKCL